MFTTTQPDAPRPLNLIAQGDSWFDYPLPALSHSEEVRDGKRLATILRQRLFAKRDSVWFTPRENRDGIVDGVLVQNIDDIDRSNRAGRSATASLR